MPDASTTTKEKTAAQLKADYDDLAKKVQAADAKGKKLEKTLLEEVKKKVKDAAGDLEKLMEQKRAAYVAWKARESAEQAEADAAKLKADAEDRAKATGRPAAAPENKAAPIVERTKFPDGAAK